MSGAAGRVGEAGRRARSVLGSVRGTVDSSTDGGDGTLPRPGRRVAVVAALAIVVVLGFNVGVAATGAVDAFRPVQSSPAGPSQVAGPASVAAASVENATFDAVNDARADADATPLEANATLRRIANYHAAEMADRGYAGPVSPSGVNVSQRFAGFGYQCDHAGQMVLWLDGARATAASELAATVVEQWQARSEHATFLADDRYDRGAVGAAWSDDGRLYVSLATCGD